MAQKLISKGLPLNDESANFLPLGVASSSAQKASRTCASLVPDGKSSNPAGLCSRHQAMPAPASPEASAAPISSLRRFKLEGFAI